MNKSGLIFCCCILLAACACPALSAEDPGKPSADKQRQDHQIQTDAQKAETEKPAEGNSLSGKLKDRTERSTGWFPGSRLYPASIADPRRVAFSGGLRYDDDAFNRYRTRRGSGSHVLGSDNMFGAVSVGSRIPIYRWNVGKGYLQADIEGCVWALFAFKKPTGSSGEGSTLLNADYYLGFITSYAYRGLALQLRFWHMSSHLGDEFLLLYPEITRRNVSNEAADIFASYTIIRQVRLFVGVGCVFHSFNGAEFDPFYFEYGAEFRPFDAIRVAKTMNFQPFIAIHMKNWQNNHFAISGDYAIGIEFAGLRDQYQPKLQLYFSFHHGPSQEGQFYHATTTYYSLTLTFVLI